MLQEYTRWLIRTLKKSMHRHDYTRCRPGRHDWSWKNFVHSCAAPKMRSNFNGATPHLRFLRMHIALVTFWVCTIHNIRLIEFLPGLAWSLWVGLWFLNCYLVDLVTPAGRRGGTMLPQPVGADGWRSKRDTHPPESRGERISRCALSNTNTHKTKYTSPAFLEWPELHKVKHRECGYFVILALFIL